MKTEKIEVKVEKTLEQKIAAMLTATDVTSTEVASLIALVEDQVSETTKQVELERAVTNSDVSAAEASRVITENEIIRSRYRANLPALQHKLDAAREREFNAQREIEYRRLKTLRDEIAADWPLASAAINTLIDLFTRTSDFNRQNSQFRQSAGSGEYLRLPALLDPELVWRGLDAFSSSQPPLHQNTQLPDVDNTRLSIWPPRPASSFAPIMTGTVDDRYTSNWGKVAEAKRHAANARIDQELADAESAKLERNRGH